MRLVSHSKRTLPLSLALPLALASGLPAQSDEPAQVAIERVPIHSAAPDSGQEYGTWAAGRSYKASFHDAPTFVPYLGRAVDVDRTLVWRTESIRVGSRVLETKAQPDHWHDDYRYEYRYGGGIVEAYDVLAEGLEQTFVLGRRPIGNGDVSVVGCIDTNLFCDPRPVAAHGALEFTEADGTSRIRYGAAVAFDAGGEFVDVGTAFDGDRITLTVPGTWLESARFPVTIDPLVTRTQIGAGTDVHESVDFARNDHSNSLLMTYVRLSSVTNWDLYAVLQGDGLAPGPSPRVVFSDLGSWNTTWARSASSDRDFCVAFQRNISNLGRRLRLHFRDSGDYTMTTNVIAGSSTPAGFDDYLPDIGGSSDSGVDRFLLVWQRDDQMDRSISSVHGKFVGVAQFNSEFTIASGSSDVERPSVSQQSRNGEEYMVVYQRNPSGPAPWWCEGRLVSPSGVSSAVWESSRNSMLSSGNPVAFPEVAGLDGRFLVSTTVGGTQSISSLRFGKEVVIERVDWLDSASAFVTRFVRSAIGPFAGNRVRVGGMAYDSVSRSHWVMTSDQNHSHGGNGYGSVQRFGFDGSQVEWAMFQTAGSSSVQTKSGGVAFDDDQSRFAFGWAVEDSSATRSWVWFSHLNYADLIAQARYGVGCSAAFIEWNGSRQRGSEFGGVRMFAGPRFQPAAVFLSTMSTQLDLDLIGMSGCDLLVSTAPGDFITSVNTSTDGLGFAKIEIPISAQVPTLDLRAQWMHLEPGANSIGVVSTQGLVAPIGM